MMHKLCLLVVIVSITGCTVGHEDYINLRNSSVGRTVAETEPYRWKDSGKLIRSDYLLAGEGLTHISKDAEGNLIYHYSVQEVLPHYHNKEWVGQCLTYEVVDPNTRVVKRWGFDKGGNPLSCRTWP